MQEKRFRKRLVSEIEEARVQTYRQMSEEVSRAGRGAVRAAAAETAKPKPIDEVRLKRAVAGVRKDVTFDRNAEPAERVAAIGKLIPNIASSKELVLKLVRLIGNKQENDLVRRAALRALKASAFASRSYSSWKPQLVVELRNVVEGGASQELVKDALETLAQGKDGWCMNELEQGLRDPSKAKVRPLDAIRYLSYDDHGSHYDILRELAVKHRSDDVREAAIKALAGDSQSVGLLKGIVQNANEKARFRQAALLTLRLLSHDDYRVESTKILDNPNEHEAVQASAITALRVDADTGADTDKRIDDLHKRSQSEVVRQAASLYLKRE